MYKYRIKEEIEKGGWRWYRAQVRTRFLWRDIKEEDYSWGPIYFISRDPYRYSSLKEAQEAIKTYDKDEKRRQASKEEQKIVKEVIHEV